jgi:hypothetical protein
MDTNTVTNLCFVVGTQYYYDPGCVYVCFNFLWQGVEAGSFLYGMARIWQWMRAGVGDF